MRIEYPYYSWAPPIEVPDGQFIGIVEPRAVPPVVDESRLIIQALANPIGTPPLSELLEGIRRVVILTDDNTRQTPTRLVLPLVLDELRKAGIGQTHISILVAYGTHRRMTEAERVQKLGGEVCASYQVEDHDAWDPARLSYRGTTEAGTEIWLNWRVAEADFVIGLGTIVPHPLAGFSGGGKILQPGVCGEQTTIQTHWLGLRYRQSELLGNERNPVRQEINTVALQAGLRFIVNAIPDRVGNLTRVVAGHPVQAWLAGCQLSRDIFGVAIPEDVDVVISDTHPGDADVWQCQKGISIAASCVRPGGTVIVLSPCPEGVAAQYPDVVRIGPRPAAVLELLARRADMHPMAGLALVRLHEATADRVVMLVSPGLDRDTIIRLGMVPYATAQTALGDALARHGPRPRVLVLRCASELLPIMSNVSRGENP
jgi:nickel-dependent lactate racemase